MINKKLPIITRPVLTRLELKTFISFPGTLYRNDPCWIEPIHYERQELLSKKNPASSHLTWQAWLAWSGTEVVGRITAQIDSLHRQLHGNDSGHFGMFEAVDDPAVVDSLFAAAEAWLRERGAARITGPFNLTINQESGLLVEGFDHPPSAMMGHGQPYYDQRLTAIGYRQATDLLAYWMRTDQLHFPPALSAMMARERKRVVVRPLDTRQFRRDMRILREIFNDAWSRNWGFVPFTESEFFELGSQLRLLVPKDLLYIAEVDGDPCAFIVAIPNINEAIASLKGQLLPFGWLRLLWRLYGKGTRTARVPLMGVKQRYQFSRLGPTLALLLIEALKPPFVKRGIEALEMSWILESNAVMRKILVQIGATPYKRYRIYEKHI
ncbi:MULTISPECIES: hypothetical protein [unclassified Pseudomonas]|uniref:hypothetical protein n=1 Tax=unclassified Pseudomonas TaxID=196821 RepID=UPI0007030F73|nr:MULTISPECIES: hypothetical protein [unclassified Pseudomonas]KQZ81563.1 DNA-binding protein [Pseudomonas sp. Root562]